MCILSGQFLYWMEMQKNNNNKIKWNRYATSALNDKKNHFKSVWQIINVETGGG